MKGLTTLCRRPFSSRWFVFSSLAIVAASIFLSMAAVSGDDGDEHRGGRSLEGSWLVAVTIPVADVSFAAIETYSAGGGLVATDGGTPPPAGNVYQGTWTRTGRGQFAFTFLGLKYTDGAHTGFIRVSQTLTLERGGDAYNGEGTVEFLDVDLNPTGFSADLTSHGERIDAE